VHFTEIQKVVEGSDFLAPSMSEPLSGRHSPMLVLRAFLERKNRDRLHTLRRGKRKGEDAVNMSKDKQR
jgi:hypothetical protein